MAASWGKRPYTYGTVLNDAITVAGNTVTGTGLNIYQKPEPVECVRIDRHRYVLEYQLDHYEHPRAG